MREDYDEDAPEREIDPMPLVETGAELSPAYDDDFLKRLSEYEWFGPSGQILAPFQVRILLDKIVGGIDPKLALRCAGIDRETLKYWLRQGRSRDSKFRDFYVFFKRQRAEAEAMLVSDIVQAGRIQWQAAFKSLEMMNPKRYSKKLDEGDKEPVRVVVLPPGEEP